MTRSEKGYADLRDRCLRQWNLHPDASGSVADLWRHVGRGPLELSAISLFAESATLIQVMRAELHAWRRLALAQYDKLDALNKQACIEAVNRYVAQEIENASPPAAAEPHN